MNVDLDIASSEDLRPLLEAMGPEVFVLHSDANRASLELDTREEDTAETCILAFCRIVRALPPAASALWWSLRQRRFDIGIEAPASGAAFKTAISPAALRELAEVGGELALTVYPTWDEPG